MFNQPLITNLSSKIFDYIFLSLLTIIYITLCAEADIYVPAFPQMIKYFGVEENQIQLILSLNFAGLCLASLIVGPLSDSYGRRKILIIGLAFLVFSSIGCVLTNNFYLMLFWRIIQGLSASVPMVIAAACLFDKYPTEKAGQYIGLVNGVIAASMAGAPIIGAWITEFFQWRTNFIVILGLALISFIGSILFIEETIPLIRRRPFSLTTIFKDYTKLIKSFRFMGLGIIAVFPFTAIVVYIANLSVIFINHLDISLKVFSYYQATTMGTFIIFSLISAKLIGKYGIDYTKNLGGILALIGSIGLFYVSKYYPFNINQICSFMAFVAAGGALMVGTFGFKAMAIFPDMNGTAMGLITFMRQLFASGLIIVSEIFFDGTIKPVATIIFVYAMLSLLLYLMIESSKIFSPVNE